MCPGNIKGVRVDLFNGFIQQKLFQNLAWLKSLSRLGREKQFQENSEKTHGHNVCRSRPIWPLTLDSRLDEG